MIHSYRAAYTSEQECSLAVCFLISGKFHTKDLWKKWLNTNKKRIIGVIHYSNCSEDEKSEIYSFVENTGSQITENSIPTSWGNMSLTHAEALMYTTVEKRFPFITHYWLVSEKTVPLQSTERTLDYIETVLKDKSQIVYIDDLRQKKYVLYENMKEYIDIKELRFGSQFKIIHKSHWSQIKQDVLNIVSDSSLYHIHWSDTNNRMMHPDEFIIPSLFFKKEINNIIDCEKPVFDKFDGDNKEHLFLI